MKYVNFLFHIYQPPTQSPGVVDRIVAECYRPLTELFLEFSDLRFTLNLTYSLVELLKDPYPEVLANIRAAQVAGTLELTATGAYHPIFPLIPEEEVRRQLRINRDRNRRDLAPDFNPVGVFPPEMAFDGHLATILHDEGYRWTVADDGIMGWFDRPIHYDSIYTFAGIGVFLRSNHWSNRFAQDHGQWPTGADAFRDLHRGMQKWMGDKDGYLVIAVDGETFGHHQKTRDTSFLRDIFTAFRANEDEIQLSHLSALFDNPAFSKRPGFIPPGSWSFDPVDIAHDDYFSWWKAKDNERHRILWELTELVLDQATRTADEKLRGQMDRALYSCPFWWASFWKFHPESVGEIYKGAFLLMGILQRAAAINGQQPEVERGERLLRDLVTQVEIDRHRAR